MGRAGLTVTLAAALGAAACNPAAGLDEGKPVAEKAAPVRAAGQWREVHTIDGKQAPGVNRCVTAEDLIKAYRLAPRPLDECATYETTMKDGAVTVRTVCTVGKSTVGKTTRATGDFQARFSLETITTMDPVLDVIGAKPRSVYAITAERTGDC